ncbi:UDP-glucose 4-epimerase GalE [Leifsonia sp. AG29]|uniref:UDP-glucose 4-epimerase GalE n=1 Tax=Leifsonia sp. AG29 TaxID=2598860 RepID=UPI00131D2009|nr:UDP-glucose 4-epimerase GalE [Leifsonia sp. AG29]
MTVLVTGGAGYIGSHVVRLLQARGENVLVVDDLSTGAPARVTAPLLLLDLAADSAATELARAMRRFDVDSVIHFAAVKDVGESVADPERYFRINVGGVRTLLDAMKDADVRRLVFSSSAAVYGNAADPVVDESDPCAPMNPYGQTKLVGEWMLDAAREAWGLSFTALRYFNVAGAGWPELRDTVAQNLIPIVVERVRSGEPPLVFGLDHPTADGSCIRDYIHVLDLAEAHLAALDALATGRVAAERLNLGTGRGASVLEVIDTVARVSGERVRPAIGTRRAGDPPALVADASRAGAVLGWSAVRGLDEIVASAWLAATH